MMSVFTAANRRCGIIAVILTDALHPKATWNIRKYESTPDYEDEMRPVAFVTMMLVGILVCR